MSSDIILYIVTLFIENNHSDGENDKTVLKGLQAFGSAVLGTDVSQFRKNTGW